MTGKVINFITKKGKVPTSTFPALPDLPDEELALLVHAHNNAAFELLVARHARMAQSLAFRLLMHSADAEDAVQEAFARWWQNPFAWRPNKGASFRTWMMQVVLNICRDKLRKKPLESLTADIDEQADNADSAEKVVLHRDLRNKLLTAIRMLPESQREALILCIYGEYTHQQAAEILQTTARAIESHIGRARATLREQLNREG